MKILALDTALGACSVAVFDSANEKILASETLIMEKGHAEELLPQIKRVMSSQSTSFDQIDRIAVTIGPGSYTGIRVGIAAARAIGLATGKPVVGVSTLSALIAPLMAVGGKGLSAAAIDARHGYIYFQAIAHGGRQLAAPGYISVHDARRLIGAGPVALAGSGGALVAYECLTHGINAYLAEESLSPDILWVARLGELADPLQARPKPLYLKEPDALPQTRNIIQRR